MSRAEAAHDAVELELWSLHMKTISITAVPDGALWLAKYGPSNIGRITTTGGGPGAIVPGRALTEGTAFLRRDRRWPRGGDPFAGSVRGHDRKGHSDRDRLGTGRNLQLLLGLLDIFMRGRG
jgi:hypothetical protein